MTTTARDRAAAAVLKVLSHDDFSDAEIAAIIRGEAGTKQRHDAFALVDAVLNAISDPDETMITAAIEKVTWAGRWKIEDDAEFSQALTAAIDAARGSDG